MRRRRRRRRLAFREGKKDEAAGGADRAAVVRKEGGEGGLVQAKQKHRPLLPPPSSLLLPFADSERGEIINGSLPLPSLPPLPPPVHTPYNTVVVRTWFGFVRRWRRGTQQKRGPLPLTPLFHLAAAASPFSPLSLCFSPPSCFGANDGPFPPLLLLLRRQDVWRSKRPRQADFPPHRPEKNGRKPFLPPNRRCLPSAKEERERE